MRVDHFDFDLPQERIALEPARPRDSARLLHIDGDTLEDCKVGDLPAVLHAGDLLVVNDTKVIPAQLFGKRSARTDGDDVSIDVTLHKRLSPDESQLERWLAFVRPAKRLRAGDEISFGEGFQCIVEERQGAECRLRFQNSRASFDAALAQHGVAPLPPYIARNRPRQIKTAQIIKQPLQPTPAQLLRQRPVFTSRRRC